MIEVTHFLVKLLLLFSQDEHYEHKLYKGDKIIWVRFWMSFLINGLGT